MFPGDDKYASPIGAVFDAGNEAKVTGQIKLRRAVARFSNGPTETTGGHGHPEGQGAGRLDWTRSWSPLETGVRVISLANSGSFRPILYRSLTVPSPAPDCPCARSRPKTPSTPPFLEQVTTGIGTSLLFLIVWANAASTRPRGVWVCSDVQSPKLDRWPRVAASNPNSCNSIVCVFLLTRCPVSA